MEFRQAAGGPLVIQMPTPIVIEIPTQIDTSRDEIEIYRQPYLIQPTLPARIIGPPDYTGK